MPRFNRAFLVAGKPLPISAPPSVRPGHVSTARKRSDRVAFQVTNSLWIQFPPKAVVDDQTSATYILLLPFQLIVGSLHVSNPLAQGKLCSYTLSLQLVVGLKREQSAVTHIPNDSPSQQLTMWPSHETCEVGTSL